MEPSSSGSMERMWSGRLRRRRSSVFRGSGSQVSTLSEESRYSGLRQKLDKLRKGHGASHAIVHDVHKLNDLYAERLLAFETEVKELLNGGELN